MPFYVTDPDSPGKHVDVIELQRRNPYKTLPPVLITDWLKHDLWTRLQAIQLLAGCLPDNPFSITNPKRYLDGTSDVQLSPLIHPLRDEILSNIITLSNWAGLSEANETKPPKKWMAWAKKKGFTPHWLKYEAAHKARFASLHPQMGNFITLKDALTDMVENAAVPDWVSPDDADSWRYSEAAATLHQSLHNTDTRPQWVEVNKATRKPLRNDAVSTEGMEILKHMAGWYQRQIKERTNHLSNFTNAGIDPAGQPVAQDLNGGKYNFLMTTWGRDKLIGIDRAALAQLFDNNEIAHGLTDDAPTPKVEAVAATPPAPATRTNKIRRNSLDPAIEKAIEKAGSAELSSVYLELKTLAIDEEKPFTGALNKGALLYTDDNDLPAELTKGALGKRLKRRRQPPSTAVSGG